MPASLMTFWNGCFVRSSRSLVICSNCARVRFSSRWIGPFSDIERYCREMFVLDAEDSSFLACSDGVAQALHRDLVLGEVDARGVLHRGEEVVDDSLVPVVATQLVVTGGRADLDGGEAVLGVLADLEEGDVEGAATEVEDEDELVLLALVEAVGEGRRGRLVDDAQDVQARDLAGLLGGLALVVVEVRGDGDDGVRHGLAEVGLRVALELLEDAGADLLRGVLLAVDVVGLPVRAHVALDRADRAVGVGHGLALGDLADQHLTALAERDDGGGGATALGVRDDGGLAALEDGDGAVRGAEVDADCTGHGLVSLVDPRLSAWDSR